MSEPTTTPAEQEFKYYVSWITVDGSLVATGSVTLAIGFEITEGDLPLLKSRVQEWARSPRAKLMGFSRLAG